MILFHTAVLSVIWRDMDLMGRPLRGWEIVWMITLKELQPMTPCPNRDKCEVVPLRSVLLPELFSISVNDRTGDGGHAQQVG